jgi:hypothetical protein
MNARGKAVCVTILSLVAALALASLMLHSETTIPVPPPGQKTRLERLEYRARFVASIDSVTLQMKSEAGAAPVVADWIFTGSNTDGQAHRVEVVVRLLDEAGKQIGVYSTRRVLPAGARSIEISLAMKVPPDVWSSAKKARIVADWMA